MRTTTRWALTAVLAAAVLASMSFGVTSDGVRGLLLGLILPAFCVGGVSAMHGLLCRLAVESVRDGRSAAA